MQNNVYSDIVLIWRHAFTCFRREKKSVIFKIIMWKKGEAMISTNHSLGYSYRLFKKFFVENYETS